MHSLPIRLRSVLLLLFPLGVIGVFLQGCASFDTPKTSLIEISVAPKTAAVQVGSAQQFTASVFNAANPKVNWQVNGVNGGDSTHGTISSAGMYTAPTKVPNPATVTITSVSEADPSQSAAALVTVMASPMSIATTSLASGEVGLAYNATLVATGGTAPYTWALTNGALPANLSLNASTGVISGTPKQAVTGLALTFQVTDSGNPAQIQSVPLSLTITPAALVSIAVTPALPSLAAGLTQQFTATGTYSDGSTQNLTNSVTWASGTPAAATINSAGLVSTLKLGTSLISATSGAVSGSTTLTVTAATLSSIAVTPALPSIAAGLTQQFTATGTYTDKSTQNLTTTATWTSGTLTTATIASGGLASTLVAGTSIITATSGAVSGSTTLTVTPPTLVTIAVTPALPSIAAGLTEQFTATGTYTDKSTQNLTTTATWTSGTLTTATIASGGLASTLVAGTSIITATSGAVSGSTTLTVTAPILTSIAVTPAGVSLGLNATQQYTATGTYSDKSTQVITSQVTWTSGTPTTASISSTGLAQVLTANNVAVSITASETNAAGTLITSPPAWLSALSTLPIVCPSPTIDLKLLVVNNAEANAGAGYADFPAIQQILNYVGTPYDVVDVGGAAPTLSDGACHGYYQGVIYAFGNDIYNNSSLYQALSSYEQTFGVRQVNWFTDPTPDFGFNSTSNDLLDTQTDTVTFTAAAQPIFYYANVSTPLTITNAAAYLTTPLAPTGGTVTPLLVDASGNTLSAITQFSDSRQYLTQMFDSNPYLTHDLVLAYGLVNWVTNGIFLGDYHVYAVPQVDDFFIDDSEWIPGTPCTDPITHDRTPPDSSTLPVFRINATTDMAALVTWQKQKQSDPLLTQFELTLAMNGVGTTGDTGWTGLPTSGAANDDLVANLKNYQSYFHWISHTFDHPTTLNGLCQSNPSNLPTCGDIYNTPPTDDIDLEVLTNLYVANGTGVNLDTDNTDVVTPLYFTDFNASNMVTPGVTGLNDPNVPIYLYNDGIRNVVSDTSVIGQPNNGPNPSPNVGIVNSYEPGIYEVPRHPNDVFYNAANWADDQAEFSCIYNNPVVAPYSTYNAAQILDYVSSTFVSNMLMGDMDPQMFHQPDLHFSDNYPYLSVAPVPASLAGLTSPHVSSLISDTYDLTFSKYEALYQLPVLSPTLDQLATNMQNRNAYNLSGATASLIGAPGAQTIQITVPATATVPAIIPVSGLNSTGAELYGTKYISHITMTPGQKVTLSVP